jgi:hypothetical protein
MPRKPMQVVQVNLRIREGLRRQLEREAKRRGVSLNFEMTSRLQETFDQVAARSIDTIGADMAVVWARYSEADHESGKLGDLLRATEALLKQIDSGEPTQAAAQKVKGVIRMIEAEALLKIRARSTEAGT